MDFFLVSEDLLGIISAADMTPGYKSDHDIVTIDLQISKYKRGRGYWKFNNSLLKETEYVNIVHAVINNTRDTYAATPYNTQNLDNVHPNDILWQISDRLYLETLLMNIRGKTISYASWRKKTLQCKERELEQKIQDIRERFQENPDSVTEDEIQNWNGYKTSWKQVEMRK